MAGTDFNQLKAVVTKSLETSGVLYQIRAQLRASVYQAINERGTRHGSQLLDGLSAALCAELIAEFFEFHGFQHSLRVFQTEAQLTLAKRGRSDVAADAGLRAVMVGCSILEQLLGRRRELDDAAKPHSQKQFLEGEDQGVIAETAAPDAVSVASAAHTWPMGMTEEGKETEMSRQQSSTLEDQAESREERTTGWRHHRPPNLDLLDEQLNEHACSWQHKSSAESCSPGTDSSQAEWREVASNNISAGGHVEDAVNASNVERELGPADEQPAESTDAAQRHQNLAEAENTIVPHDSRAAHAESEHEMGVKAEPLDYAGHGESDEQSMLMVDDQSVASASSTPQRMSGVSTLTAAALSSSMQSPASSHRTLRGTLTRLPPLGESAPGLPPAHGPGTRLAPLTSPVSSAASLAQAATQGTLSQTPSGTASPSGIHTPSGILSPAGSSGTLGNSLGDDRSLFSSMTRPAKPLPPLSAGISASTEACGIRPSRRRVKEKESKRAAERSDWSPQHDSSLSTMDTTGAPQQLSAASRLAKALKGTTASGATGSESDEEEAYSEVAEDVLGTSASCDSFPPGPLMRQTSESVSVVDSVSGLDSSLPAMDEVSSEQGHT